MLPRRAPSRAHPDPGARDLENALRGLAVPGPDPDFEKRLRARLLAVGAIQAGAATSPPRRWRPPSWLPRAVAAGAAGVVGVAGVGVATSRALPGQPLYGAKRQIESWQLSAASGQADRGREQLAFARTRMAEVEAMSQHQDLASGGGTNAGSSNADRIASTLRRMDAETRAGAADLVAAARSGDARVGRELLAFADDQSTRLTAVVPRLPAPAAPAVVSSRSLLHQVAALARTLPGATTPSAAQGRTPPPHPSLSHNAERPTSPPPPTTRAPAPDGTGSPAAPSTLPSGHPVTSPPPTAPPTGAPPLGLPTAVTGLMNGQSNSSR